MEIDEDLSLVRPYPRLIFPDGKSEFMVMPRQSEGRGRRGQVPGIPGKTAEQIARRLSQSLIGTDEPCRPCPGTEMHDTPYSPTRVGINKPGNRTTTSDFYFNSPHPQTEMEECSRSDEDDEDPGARALELETIAKRVGIEEVIFKRVKKR